MKNWALYKKSSNKFIDQIWNDINTLIRKIKNTQSKYASLISTSSRIQSLLKFFFDEYFVIRDTFDTQDEQNHEMIIQKFQKKKTTLNKTKKKKFNEIVMYAKRQKNRRYFHSNFDINMFDVFRNKNEKRRQTKARRRSLCFFCDFFKHDIRDCSKLDEFKIWLKKRDNKENRNKKKKKTHKNKNKHHVLIVDEKTWTFDFELNDLNEEKIVVLSEKMINNLSKNVWIVVLNSNAREAITNSMNMWKTWDNNRFQLYQRTI